MRTLLKIFCLLFSASIAPGVQAQDTGSNFGIPNSSPGVFWPRGMGIEALSPTNLYPNGPQFGLSNTSGGFGMSGSGPASGVGLEQRSVSPLVRQEMANPGSFFRSLNENFNRESQRSNVNVGAALAGSFRTQINTSTPDTFAPKGGALITPYALPGADAVLQDRVQSTDSILNGGAGR